eukprot:s2_g44.t2
MTDVKQLIQLDTLLQKVYQRQGESSGSIAAHIASLERQICKLQDMYPSPLLRKDLGTARAAQSGVLLRFDLRLGDSENSMIVLRLTSRNSTGIGEIFAV